MANGYDYPPQPQQGTIFSGLQRLGGMFSNLQDRVEPFRQRLHPFANRLTMGGLGMLSGGPRGAMYGMVAGSALDKEDADKRRFREALAQLAGSESGLIPDDPAIRGLMAEDEGFAKDVLLQGLKGADTTDIQRNYNLAVQQGYTGTLMDFMKDTKSAGVTINTGQIPAEMGARIGLGDAFLDELNVAGMGGGPTLREQITTVFGGDPISQAKARTQLAAGMGKPAAIWRRVESGKEALVRNLTGAGMSMSEAQAQASRYSISATDSVETMLSKMNGLERDLVATREGAIDARKGTLDEPGAGGGTLKQNPDGSFTWMP